MSIIINGYCHKFWNILDYSMLLPLYQEAEVYSSLYTYSFLAETILHITHHDNLACLHNTLDDIKVITFLLWNVLFTIITM